MEILKICPLFAGVEEKDISAMLGCLGARRVDVKKNQMIFTEGEAAESVGIVLSGNVQVVREDYYGNRSIVAGLEPGNLFGETFACAEIDTLPVSVVAATDGEIMLINCRRILTTCGNACEFHNRMVRNLLKVVAKNNIILNRKIELLSKKTTREKIMTYLLSEAKRCGREEFEIPFDRQELADYLGVERSAMAAEISKLRKTGLIECRKSWFRLL